MQKLGVFEKVPRGAMVGSDLTNSEQNFANLYAQVRELAGDEVTLDILDRFKQKWQHASSMVADLKKQLKEVAVGNVFLSKEAMDSLEQDLAEAQKELEKAYREYLDSLNLHLKNFGAFKHKK